MTSISAPVQHGGSTQCRETKAGVEETKQLWFGDEMIIYLVNPMCKWTGCF